MSKWINAFLWIGWGGVWLGVISVRVKGKFGER